MLTIKTDLHIHTALSTNCDPDMCPGNIVERAKELKLNLIGITDYNSTNQAAAVKNLAAEAGIFTLTGAEVISSEGIHVLVFLEQPEELNEFQQFLDSHLPLTEINDSESGYQIIFDEFDEIITSENRLLKNPLNCKLTAISAEVNRLNGILIPAHCDRSENSILSEFGCIPSDIKVHALESSRISKDKLLTTHPELKYYPVIRGSNAKETKDIGNGISVFKVPEISFQALKKIFSLNENHDIIII